MGNGIPNYNAAMGNIFGVEEETFGDIEIYPNPFQDKLLKILFNKLKIPSELTINIYNSEGQMVVTKQQRNIISG